MEIKHSKTIKPFRKLKLLGFSLCSIILIIAISGYMYEYISYKNAQINYPPDGQMIDVGDRKIHVNIQGIESSLPPVIIETGTGSWSYDWINIQEELSKHTQVITYDRAGYGWSDPATDGFSINTTINDLNNIYETLEIDTPVILVGHSVGGIYARLFADKYPDKVSGLILVDSRNEFFSEQATKYSEKFFEASDESFTVILSRFGLVRLFGANNLSGMPDYISIEKYVNVHYDTPFFKVLNEEIKQIPNAEKLLLQTNSLGEKPLKIITPTDVELLATELGFSEQEEEKLNKIWVDSQKQLTHLSNNSELILVPNSSHSVMYDQPEVIVKAVLDMIEE